MDDFNVRQTLSTNVFLDALSQALPQERLDTLAFKNEESRLSPSELYAKNLEVSANLWILFHILEIVLRNAISDRLLHMFPAREWWEDPGLFHRQEGGHIRDALRKSLERKGSVTKGDVIAGLNFGFWTILISGPYHQYLREAGLSEAFPGYSGKRKTLFIGLERLRKLRNRIAHHEPILNRDYLFDVQLILQIIGYVNPKMGSALVENYNTVRC